MSPVDSAHIRTWTQKDPVLSKVLRYSLTGWPEYISDTDSDTKPYFTRRAELSVTEGCILWGNRVIIPPQGREVLLQELHEGHLGMSKMKALARSVFWWPGLDAQIEEMVKTCESCQMHSSTPSKVPMSSWTWPERPWSRLHIDYAGPFMNHMFLIIVDAHSKWMEVHITSSTSSQVTIDKLRSTFAQFGIPDILVSDNATTFTSEEFREITHMNGITHKTSAPYHPASNGLAERAVQTVKNGLKRMAFSVQIQNYTSYNYRNFTGRTTHGSSSEIAVGPSSPRSPEICRD